MDKELWLTAWKGVFEPRMRVAMLRTHRSSVTRRERLVQTAGIVGVAAAVVRGGLAQNLARNPWYGTEFHVKYGRLSKARVFPVLV